MGLDDVDSSTKADNDRIDHDAFPAENLSRRSAGSDMNPPTRLGARLLYLGCGAGQLAWMARFTR